MFLTKALCTVLHTFSPGLLNLVEKSTVYIDFYIYFKHISSLHFYMELPQKAAFLRNSRVLLKRKKLTK